MTDQEFLRVFLRGWPPGDRFGHCDAMGVLTVDEAIERVPLFLHKGLPMRHSSRAAMFGTEARVRWVDPDLVPLTI